MDSEIIGEALKFKCFEMACKHNVCPDTPRTEMKQVIEFSHDKGYLYTNRLANTFICGYRIPETSKKWITTIPSEEKGEVFFVNFALSEDPNKWILLKMLRSYLKENPDVKEITYFRRNSEKDFKRIHIKGVSHVQK